mgnify:CR=1 FL=1
MLGLNRSVIVRLPSEAAWRQLGDLLGPKEPWAALLGDRDSSERTGGMRSITMERSKRPDGSKGYIRVTVESLTTGFPEIKVNINDHYVLSKEDGDADGARACKVIDENWERSSKRTEQILKALLDKAR